MANRTVPKKDDPLEDWLSAKIVYELRLKGWSMRRLSKAHGLSPQAVSVCIQQPWPRVERLVAKALGVKPWNIWPSRYPEKAQAEREAA